MITINIKGTTIRLVDDGITIIANRWINNRVNRVITTCDGTTLDFTTNVNKLYKLSNDMFEDFARIQHEELLDRAELC